MQHVRPLLTDWGTLVAVVVLCEERLAACTSHAARPDPGSKAKAENAQVNGGSDRHVVERETCWAFNRGTCHRGRFQRVTSSMESHPCPPSWFSPMDVRWECLAGKQSLRAETRDLTNASSSCDMRSHESGRPNRGLLGSVKLGPFCELSLPAVPPMMVRDEQGQAVMKGALL